MKPARDMTDSDLAAEMTDLGKQWDDMRRALDECGGMSGSPGEWMWERMAEIEAEQKSRQSSGQRTGS
jgi:hypothetical protein